MDLKCNVYIGNNTQKVNVSFGTKNGNSPYLVSKARSFYELSDYKHWPSGVRKITQSEQNKWCNPVSNYVMPVPAVML